MKPWRQPNNPQKMKRIAMISMRKKISFERGIMWEKDSL